MNTIFTTLPIIYLTLVNVTAFALMGFDKHRARHHLWRIPEKRLFLSAILGGSVGAILGMYVFRHKTKHASFVYGMPVILLIQLALITVCLRSRLPFR